MRRRNILTASLRAALITSLGFSHVSAVLAIAHPDTSHASLPPEQRDDYLRRAGVRRAQGARRRLETRLGHPPLVRRPIPPQDRDTEAATLLKGVRPLHTKSTKRNGPVSARDRGSRAVGDVEGSDPSMWA